MREARSTIWSATPNQYTPDPAARSAVAGEIASRYPTHHFCIIASPNERRVTVPFPRISARLFPALPAAIRQAPTAAKARPASGFFPIVKRHHRPIAWRPQVDRTEPPVPDREIAFPPSSCGDRNVMTHSQPQSSILSMTRRRPSKEGRAINLKMHGFIINRDRSVLRRQSLPPRRSKRACPTGGASDLNMPGGRRGFCKGNHHPPDPEERINVPVQFHLLTSPPPPYRPRPSG